MTPRRAARSQGKNLALRQAMFTVISVKDIMAKTVAQFDPGVK
ncbi:hypothetical protein [Streptomyces sp. NPDC054804]